MANNILNPGSLLSTTGITYNDKKFYIGTVSSFQQNFSKLSAAEKAKFNNAITFIGDADSSVGGLSIMVMMAKKAADTPVPYYFTMGSGSSGGTVRNIYLTVRNDDDEYFRDQFTFNRALNGYNLDATSILSNVFLKKSDWKDAFVSEGKVVVVVKATNGDLYDKNDCIYNSGNYTPKSGASAIEDSEVTGEGKYIRFTMTVQKAGETRQYVEQVNGQYTEYDGRQWDYVGETDWVWNDMPLYEWYAEGYNMGSYIYTTVPPQQMNPTGNTGLLYSDGERIMSEAALVDITEAASLSYGSISPNLTEYIYVSIGDMVSDPAIITTTTKTSTQTIGSKTYKFNYEDYEMSDGIVDNKVITQWETQDCAWGFIRNPHS